MTINICIGLLCIPRRYTAINYTEFTGFLGQRKEGSKFTKEINKLRNFCDTDSTWKSSSVSEQEEISRKLGV